MQGLQQLLAIAETAKHGSFAAAAREAGDAPSICRRACSVLLNALGTLR